MIANKTLILSLLAVCTTIVAAFGQEGNMALLLDEAEAMSITRPSQASDIADFALKNSVNQADVLRAHLIAGKAHYASGRYSESVTHTFKALTPTAAVSSQYDAREATWFARQLLRQLKLQGAIHLLPEIPENSNGGTYPHLSLYAMLDAGYTALNNGDTVRTLAHWRRAASVASAAPESVSRVGCDPLVAISALFAKQELADSAAYYMALAQQKPYAQGEANLLSAKIYISGAELHFINGRHEEAVGALNRALEFADRALHLEMQKDIHEKLGQNHLAMGDPSGFQHHQGKATSLSLPVEALQDAATNALQAAMHQNMEQEHEVALAQWVALREALLALLLVMAMVAVGIALKNVYRLRNAKDLLRFAQVNAQLPVQEVTATEKTTVALPKQSAMPEETELVLLEKLELFEKSKKYLSNDMSLAHLASLLDTNTKYLSEVINKHKEKNFNSYVNELRINYIIHQLRTNATYRNYKVSYLAEESGYSSHSSFTTVFRTVTGMSPAKYIKILSQEKEALALLKTEA